MSESSPFGIVHFWEQIDAVGIFVLAILLLMSLACWYLIFAKIWQQWHVRAASEKFLGAFNGVRTYQEAEDFFAQILPMEPFGRILARGMDACQVLQSSTVRRGFEMEAADDFVREALESGIANEEYALEKGLSVLASVGATAPFVGLFGTVWGIYRALLSIGFSGQAGLDQIAGPIGEALIMTACGLAVAIPAVLAYNVFVRANRNLIGKLESHAHHVFTLLAVGNVPEDRMHRVPPFSEAKDETRRRVW